MARPKGASQRDTKRVQIEMPARSLARLKSLVEKTEAASYSEVIRNALQLYEAIIVEVEDGHKILVDRDGDVSPYPIFSA